MCIWKGKSSILLRIRNPPNIRIPEGISFRFLSMRVSSVFHFNRCTGIYRTLHVFKKVQSTCFIENMLTGYFAPRPGPSIVRSAPSAVFSVEGFLAFVCRVHGHGRLVLSPTFGTSLKFYLVGFNILRFLHFTFYLIDIRRVTR